MPEPTTPRPLDASGLAVAVFCCALWGGNSVATKYAIADGALPPVGGAALRFLVSLPVVAWVCARGGTGFAVARRDLGLLFLNGFLTAVQIATFNWGTSRSDAGRSSVFINVHPLIVAPLAWLFLGEHLGTRGLFGLGSAAFGVAIILSKKLAFGGGLEGDLVVLISAVIFGFQTILQKRTFPRIAGRTLVFAQTVVAIPLVGAWSLLFEGVSDYHFTRESVGGLLYQGLASSGICFSLWLILLGRYSVSRLATIAFLTPLFGITLGNILRGEPLTLNLVLGGGLVGLGIYLVASGRPTERPAPESSDGLAASNGTRS
jgi:drug/metabolite transporter (DMT)-like permease